MCACMFVYARKETGTGGEGYWFVCVCTHKDTGRGVGWFVYCKYTHVRTLVLGGRSVVLSLKQKSLEIMP